MAIDNSWLKTAKVGDLVTSTFREDESGVVRKITAILKSAHFGSGYGVVADGGEPCPCCGRQAKPAESTVNYYLDGAHFQPVTSTSNA